LSLVSRILGFGMCLVAGLMIGYVQGIQSIVDAVVNIVHATGYTLNVASFATSIALYIETAANPDLGSYWIFGILLAFGGLFLVAREDRGPRDTRGDPREGPILTQPAAAAQ
jgi:hypothetical protein